jgi:hypothetical protein
MTWDELLASYAGDTAPSSTLEACPATNPSRAILSEIAKELQTAASGVSRADQTLTQAGSLPPKPRAEMATDPQYGRPEERQDWFIEPLLTVQEVASVLRLSTRAVRRLPIHTLLLAGEVRYRQSEIRGYLKKQEAKPRSW